ncbi:RagB/SusD family nutrient uptake outer membrane protein [Labilibaculum sp.]|uniref:RagB/SusD family nutrient uptake outer membrane protein n=1 Tax=Labilibaculum sp. TaxID=2060723 RepID=UPI0035620477
MKNKIYLLLLLAIVAFSGCSDDEFFDTLSDTDLETDLYWTTATDYELVCNGLYTFYTGHSTKWTNSPIVFGDDKSDNLVPETVNEWAAGLYTVPSSDASYTYSTVRTINTLLEAADETDLTFTEISTYVGEANFFKAEFYFEKCKRYGAYQWLDEVLDEDSGDLYSARDSRNTCMDSAMACINRAIDYLDEGTSNHSRIHRNIALAAKARMALHEGTYRKYHDSGDYTEYLQEAYDAALELMESGDYSLQSDFRTLFSQEDKSDSPEVILMKDYEVDLLTTAILYELNYNNNNEGVSKSLVDDFLCTDGLPISQSSLYDESEGWFTEFNNRDSRLSVTVAAPDSEWLDGTYPNINGAYVSGTETPEINNTIGVSTTGYLIEKHWDNNATNTALAQWAAYDAIIYRYGETLLIYAEAAYELGVLTQDDVDKSINLLRARAGMPDMVIADLVKDADSDFSDIDATLDEIRRERRVELAIENFRYDDLMRWAAGDLLENRLLGMKFMASYYPNVEVDSDLYLDDDGYIWPYATDLPDGRTFTSPQMYLYPLPTDELTLNPNLTQNPGW